MTRYALLLSSVVVSGCSYFQKSAPEKPAPATTTEKPVVLRPSAVKVSTANSLLRAMHDRFGGKYLKTMSFLQNNTAYSASGEERKSQWYEHMELPGKLRIAFLPATQRSGLVQVGERVASFDNGVRVDFRPSVNPLLLLTADIHAAPMATIMRGLDSLNVNTDVMRTTEWEGRPVYVVGAKEGDTTSSQMWIDAERLQLLRFIQRDRTPARTVVSDIRVKGYKEVEGFEIPTEFLVIRNGRPVWREQYANIRVNDPFPAGTFDQARWNDIPIPD